MVGPIAGWELAATEPGAVAADGLSRLDALAWAPVRVPVAVGAAAPADAGDPDAVDRWFRARFAADPGARAALCLDGLATIAEVYVNGELVLRSESMFIAHEVDLAGRLRAENELAICCRALRPLLARPRRPRARWRSRLTEDGNLRWFRTSLLGRMPGFSPPPPVNGPWRAVRVESRDGPRIAGLRVRARLDGDAGEVTVAGVLEGASTAHAVLGGERCELAVRDGRASANLRLPGIERWWPHTHGSPALHELRILTGEHTLAERQVGFRTLAAGPRAGHDVLADGIDLHVNGVRVFARGAVWVPVADEDLRPTLERLAQAGMNLVRVVGTTVYESAAFHGLCDELGILVWQDLMFANLDYPVGDERFRALVRREAEQLMERLAPRPSLGVVCGNSEVEQQVAMLGLDPALGRGELFGELLPAVVRASESDAVYLPSAPTGTGIPFRPARGVANYFGVGGYRRPLADVRHAGVRFASECLAFANVAVDDPADRLDGVPGDVGADWDFADVRDHYLEQRFGVEPARLWREDPDRYLELSRAVTGELMAEVFGEWRRGASPCGGGIVLWWRDLIAGSGWGVLDHRGRPKPAWHHLRRALSPVAVWTTDEGLGGIAAHVANEGPDALVADVRVALYRDLELPVGEASAALTVPARTVVELDVEELLGRFADVSWAYRFGPPQQDLVVVSLERDGKLLGQALRLPLGPPRSRQPAAVLGLRASACAGGVLVATRRLAYGVRVAAPGFEPLDDWFCVEPGHERMVQLRPLGGDRAGPGGELRAVNLAGAVAW